MLNPLQNALQAVGPESADPRTALVQAKIRGLLQGYDARWTGCTWRVNAVETTLMAGLWNPETEASSRTFQNAGKIDVDITDTPLGSDGPQRFVVDHKTCSESIDDAAADYWRSLVIEGQLSQYMLLGHQNGIRYDSGIWDVCRKPGISPRKITIVEMKEMKATRTWFCATLSDIQIESSFNTGRESLELYSMRVAHDCTKERPQYYFQRRQIPRTDGDLIEYAQDTWDLGQELIASRAVIREFKKRGIDRQPQRSAKACFMHNSPCEFLKVCTGEEMLEGSERWQKKEWMHPELPILKDGNGTDVLTNSRLGVFQVCRRKHHLKYELGYERPNEEEKVALFFGTMWHSALEAYFKAVQINQRGESIDSNITGAASSAAAITASEDQFQIPF